MEQSNLFDHTVIDWLLEPEEPGVRYLALRDLVCLPADDPELVAARHLAHTGGPIQAVLANMQPEGYWSEPGPGYLPKYTSTAWSLVLLAQLGASAHEDRRISHACAYLLEQALCAGGQLSMNGTPSGTIDCLQGNLLWAMLTLGYSDTRLEAAFDWMARTVTGEGIAPRTERDAEPRYYAGKCGPGFACGANNNQPCAWGAAKVMLAFGMLPESNQTPLIKRAILQGVEFLAHPDPVKAAWPAGYTGKPSGNWWKFGFPVFYVTDLLQVAEALVTLGYGDDPRLANLMAFIREKADTQGRWLLEYDYGGKTWVDFGAKKQPNKWVTLRALKVLKNITKDAKDTKEELRIFYHRSKVPFEAKRKVFER